jgi:hypothetical protein
MENDHMTEQEIDQTKGHILDAYRMHYLDNEVDEMRCNIVVDLDRVRREDDPTGAIRLAIEYLKLGDLISLTGNEDDLLEQVESRTALIGELLLSLP